MQVLISAFACAPGRGSEPGVGWNWARTLAQISDHRVTVLTQERNRAAIEQYLVRHGDGGVKFRFVSLLGNGRIPGGTIGHYCYYYLWQVKALLTLLATGEWRAFGLIHHLTYGGIRAGSLLWILPRPFMLGPVGGGESAPFRLLANQSLRNRLVERLRALSNLLCRIDPLIWATQLRSVRLLAKTADTARVFWLRSDTVVALEIGIHVEQCRPANEKAAGEPFRILYASRLIYWKGCDLLLEAVRQCEVEGPAMELIIAGDGVQAARMRKLAGTLAATRVTFTGRIAQSALFELYREADLFAFPSLHDSSGNAVLEAMSFGVPVICFDLGGPPVVVGDGGIAVDVSDATPHEASSRLARAIRELRDNLDRRRVSADAAYRRARALTWERAVRAGYGPLLFGAPGEREDSG